MDERVGTEWMEGGWMQGWRMGGWRWFSEWKGGWILGSKYGWVMKAVGWMHNGWRVGWLGRWVGVDVVSVNGNMTG